MIPFRDRTEAGRTLARHLISYADCPGLLVLALPRGGVPVAFEAAQALHAPLDVFLVRKLGVPGQEELAMGALATGGVCVINEDVVQALHLSDDVIAGVAGREAQELARRERSYRGGRPAPDLRGRPILLIDDGLATGATMRAAARAIRRMHPARLVIAVPVASGDTCASLQSEADEVIFPHTPDPFGAVGCWYKDFTQTTDAEVQRLLAQAQRSVSASV